MTKQDDEEKQNVRMMWMATGAIVLFIVGLMGLSMLGMLGNQSGTAPTDMSSQSRIVADKLTDRLGDFCPRLKAGAERIAN